MEKWKGEEELMGKGEKKEGSRKEEREKVEGWNSERSAPGQEAGKPQSKDCI